jgi:hypothetical protein
MSVVRINTRNLSCPGAVQRANAAPQRRDHWRDMLDGPRTSSAPLTRCAASGTRSTWTLALLLCGSLGRARQLAQPAFRGSIGFRGRFGLSANNLAERRKKLTRQFLRR